LCSFLSTSTIVPMQAEEKREKAAAEARMAAEKRQAEAEKQRATEAAEERRRCEQESREKEQEARTLAELEVDRTSHWFPCI
jgi:hypothetical protein